MQPDWLLAALDYLPRWIELQVRLFEQPGCVVAVAHRDQLLFEAAFGSADLRDGTPLTPRHRFRVASHSKTFTAAGIMKLRERGAVGLDDTLGAHVPGLHPALAGARVAQLLSHSAGVVRDGTTADAWCDRRPFADDVELAAALAEAPTVDPNTRFKYSNYGYALLGRLIEAVTGEAYGDWIAREIVGAAGLGETTPDMPLPDGTPVACGHGGKLPLGRRVVLPGHQPTGALRAATGFVSTAADLARFFALLIPSSPTDVLTADSRREMTRARWQNPDASLERTYGLGTMSGGKRDWWWFGHGGGFQGFITHTLAVPAHEVAVSVVTNAIDGMAPLWATGALHVLATFAKYGAPTDAVRDWAGRWWNIWSTVDLVPMGGSVLTANPALTTPFSDASTITIAGPDEGTIVRANGFASHGEPVQRVRDASGAPSEIRFAGGTLVPEARLAAELVARESVTP